VCSDVVGVGAREGQTHVSYHSVHLATVAWLQRDKTDINSFKGDL
jgi:hypothetical protein